MGVVSDIIGNLNQKFTTQIEIFLLPLVPLIAIYQNDSIHSGIRLRFLILALLCRFKLMMGKVSINITINRCTAVSKSIDTFFP